MPSSVAVHHFASFAQVSSSVDSTRCIHPIIGGGHRPCQHSVNKDDASRTPSKLNDIRNAAGTTNLADIVREFILLKCCHNVHQKRLRSSDLLNKLVQRWIDELDGPSQHEQKGCQVTEKRVVLHKYPTRSQTQHESSEEKCAYVTPSQDASLDTSSSTHRAAEFAPYVRSPKYTVKAKLEEPLTKTAWKTGTVYMFTRPSSPGYVKIGYTTVSVSSRMRQWEKSCHYTPLVQHAIHNVPHVFRVEQLIHTELSEYWRREKRCKHNSDCPRQHQEWFEIAIEQAKQVMSKWTQWVKSAKPYNESGLLRNEWSNVCRRTREEGKMLTAQLLLYALVPPHNEVLTTRSGDSLTDETVFEQPTHQASQTIPSRTSLHTKDLAKLSRLLEELNREVHVLSYQRRLRTASNASSSNTHMPAPGQESLSTAARAVPTIA